MLTLTFRHQLQYAIVNLIGFCMFCVIANLVTKAVNEYFFAQMMSCDVTYEVIYHPFPINS